MDEEVVVAETGAPEVGNEKPESQTNIQELSIPDNWDSGIKEYLGTLKDIKAKEAYYNRVKDLETRYNTRTEEFANKSKAEKAEIEKERQEWQRTRAVETHWDKWSKSLSPAKIQAIRESYGSEASYISRLHELNEMAEENPEEFAIRIVQGIGGIEKIQELMNGNVGTKVGSELKIQDVEKRIMEQIESRENQKRAQEEYNSFVNAKDESGNAKYPHFEEVRGKMSQLLQVYQDKQLPELYDMAVRLTPEIFDMQMKANQQETQIAETAKEVIQKKATATGIPQKATSGVASVKKESANDLFRRLIKQ